MQGHIARKVAARGFGFIQDGTAEKPGFKEWFFHRKDCSPMSPFHVLREGDAVEFEEEMGDKGPKALSVNLA